MNIQQKKETLKDVFHLYGEKYHELKIYQKAWKKKEKHDDNFFKLSVMPTTILIEPTNRCNKKCKYCARSSMIRNNASISLDTFKKALKSLTPGIYITLTGNGEPMLNNQIYGMINYAVKRGFVVGTITNGTVLTDNNIKKLIETGIHRVQISFDTVVRDIFNDSYNNPKGACDFEETLKKILNFIYIARTEYNKSPFITIAQVMTEEVKAVNKKNRAFWNKMPIDNLYEGPFFTLQTNSSTYTQKKNYLEHEEWKICVNPFTSVKINSDGSVNPCGHDFSSKYIIGNINEDSLSNVINSDKAIRLRKALYEEDINFFSDIGYNCHKCNVWTSSVKGDIEGYCKNTFPIAYGLMANEIYKSNSYSAEKILLLKDLSDNFSQEKIEKIIN